MDIYRVLFAMAKLKSGDNISPCCGKPWSKSFQAINGVLFLYYNDQMHSTHTVSLDVSKIIKERA